mmetsp:Transcript_27997/g.32289  ORF Transcript_27997/g.32289 Transcript_27997/m.32289 type:complete len:95 (+) Transcript_27997:322-606(+)
MITVWVMKCLSMKRMMTKSRIRKINIGTQHENIAHLKSQNLSHRNEVESLKNDRGKCLYSSFLIAIGRMIMKSKALYIRKRKIRNAFRQYIPEN